MKFNEKYNDPSYIEFQDNREQVFLKDQRGGNVSYKAENPKRYTLIAYNVEGGIIKEEHKKKCDFGLFNVTSGVLRLIELKGGDCSEAIDQIISTMQLILAPSITDLHEVHSRIVLSKARTPEMNTSKEKKLKRMLAKRKGTLKIKCKVMHEVL